MNELPYIMFSSDAKLVSDHMMLLSLPEYRTYSELENAFFSAMTSDDRIIFRTFCSSDAVHTRIFPLINFYPYHFAFAEKLRIGNDIGNIVFVAKDTQQLHSLMSPTSESLREITNKLIREINNPGDCDEEITFPTPESLLAMTHINNFESFARFEVSEKSYCDIRELVERVCESFSLKELYSDIKFDLSHRGTDKNIIEFPCANLIYVLCSVFTLLHALSNDRVIKISTYKFAYAGEITIETTTSLSDKLPGVCTALSDFAYDVPSFSAIAQSATVVSILSELILSVDVDRERDSVKVTIGVGFDYQTEPDFKFSDPYSGVDNIVNEALAIIDNIK